LKSRVLILGQKGKKKVYRPGGMKDGRRTEKFSAYSKHTHPARGKKVLR